MRPLIPLLLLIAVMGPPLRAQTPCPYIPYTAYYDLPSDAPHGDQALEERIARIIFPPDSSWPSFFAHGIPDRVGRRLDALWRRDSAAVERTLASMLLRAVDYDHAYTLGSYYERLSGRAGPVLHEMHWVHSLDNAKLALYAIRPPLSDDDAAFLLRMACPFSRLLELAQKDSTLGRSTSFMEPLSDARTYVERARDLLPDSLAAYLFKP